MKKVILGLVTMLFVLSACHHTDCPPADCYFKKDALSVEEKNNACTYKDIYRYQGKMYAVYVCCVCDLFPMAVDCDGESLCEVVDYNSANNCMTDFWKHATYLFSVPAD